jgi:hypothetical protein
MGGIRACLHPAPAAVTVETGNRFEGLQEEDPGEGGYGKE